MSYPIMLFFYRIDFVRWLVDLILNLKSRWLDAQQLSAADSRLAD